MGSRNSRIGLSLLVVALFFASGWCVQSSLSADEKKAPANRTDVTVVLKVCDKPSGLLLEAKRTVVSGSNAFDMMRNTVPVNYKTFPKLGPLVTGICGVDAPDGVFWALYVDGKFSDVGIGSITFDKNTLIEWKTQKIER